MRHKTRTNGEKDGENRSNLAKRALPNVKVPDTLMTGDRICALQAQLGTLTWDSFPEQQERDSLFGYASPGGGPYVPVAVGTAVKDPCILAYDGLAEGNTGDAKLADIMAGSLKGAN